MNPTTRRACLPGVVGEVWVTGTGIAVGYWNKQEATDATFHAMLDESEGGPYLRTGDLGFIHSEELFLTGRLKDLIIVRGRNYYPHDLEWTAEHTHPGLRRGCGAAFSVEGEAGERVVLVHEVEKHLQEADALAVMTGIRRAMADEYELEIHTVVLIKSGTIPRTSSGKIQRHACKAAFEANQLTVVGSSTLESDRNAETDGVSSESPHTSVETRLADIWQEVLGGPLPHRQANFFSLGGNSLLAAQVVARILDVFHIELPLSVLFECPTLSGLATRIDELSTSPDDTDRAAERRSEPGGDGGTRIPLVPLRSTSTREGRLPLSASQQRLWFLEQVHPGSAINHIAMSVRIHGPVNPEVLERSIQE
ncbi:MAG: phosphopantetheine-binding protein, partial [Nitrospira sp.]